MRSLGERLNLLRKLIIIKCGPGAALLPPTVSRVHMDFAITLKGGHMGARKFWREMLPRLKYHNPSIPMIVNRHTDNDTPPRMSIYLRKAEASASANADAPTDVGTQPASSRTNLSKAQPPGPDERVVHIDMKDKHSTDILEYFIAETRATPLEPTKEDIAEMQALEVLRKKSEADRERVQQARAAKKREEDMVKRARIAGGLEADDSA